jgi:hypothetical protein
MVLLATGVTSNPAIFFTKRLSFHPSLLLFLTRYCSPFYDALRDIFRLVNVFQHKKLEPETTEAVSEQTIIQKAREILLNTGVVVCATDTGYLLGVDGLNPEAIWRGSKKSLVVPSSFLDVFMRAFYGMGKMGV